MKKILSVLIKLYQVFLAKILFGLFSLTPLSPCRHLPSCSDYALEAFEKFGVIKGTHLGLKRLIKCRPGGTFGFDPVP